jgi:hypothetical protein
MAGWHFISIPKSEGQIIKKDFRSHAKGWGSIPVAATIGKTSWKTSIFPEKSSGSYLLPVKAAVRKAEGIFDKSEVVLILKII